MTRTRTRDPSPRLQFGTFFLFTIFWAYLWAVLFLMPLLAFIGPEGVGPHAVAKADDKTPA